MKIDIERYNNVKLYEIIYIIFDLLYLFRHNDSRLGSITFFLFRSIPCIYIDNQV